MPTPPSLASNAKPDTVFLSTDAAGMEVDLSQYDTDLTDATTYWYETASNRTNVIASREVSITFEADENTAAGTLVTHGARATSNNTYTIRYDGSWQVELYQESSSSFLTVALPGSAPVAAVSITIQWSTRVDVINGNYQHEIWVWRQDSDVREIHWVNGKAGPTGGARFFVIGASSTGGTDNYGDTIEMCRVGDAFHSTTEAAQDWRDEPSEPSVSGDTRLELASQEASDGLGHDAESAGPVYVSGAAALNQNEFRLLGPILNKVYLQGARAAWEPQEDADDPKIIVTGTDYESWNTSVEFNPGIYMTVLLPFCHYRSPPPNASHAHVRVLLSYVATNPMQLICQMSTQRPNSPGVGFTSYVNQSVSTSGSNQEIDLGLLPIAAPGEPNWIYLGFYWEDNPDDATITIFSWNVIAAYKEA